MITMSSYGPMSNKTRDAIVMRAKDLILILGSMKRGKFNRYNIAITYIKDNHPEITECRLAAEELCRFSDEVIVGIYCGEMRSDGVFECYTFEHFDRINIPHISWDGIHWNLKYIPL